MSSSKHEALFSLVRKSLLRIRSSSEPAMKRLGALMLDRSLDSGRRRTDEQAQLGNGALTLRFIGYRKSFNGVGYLQEVDRDRGRIGVHGKTDGTGRGIARNRAISVAVGRSEERR